MTIFVRIFLVFSLALCLGGILLVLDLQQQIRPGMRQVLEDTLADNAQTLAATLAPALADGSIRDPQWRDQLRIRLNPAQNARIHHHHKTENRQQLVITDARGLVLYHSNASEIGRDYSQWNDILRTLRGEYGARSTDNTMYVAAPIRASDGSLFGVVSLGKPSADILPYQERAQAQLRHTALLYLLASLALIALLTLWIRHSIDRVRRYATAHAREQQAPRFHLAAELNRLTDAISTMRRELEDRAYVTRYIETLTHELKSPLTAIAASAELLHHELPAADRERFAASIQQQSERLHRLVQKLLQLSRIEKDPVHPKPLALAPLWQALASEYAPRLARKQLQLISDFPPQLILHADPFWLEQALANLLDNAIRESPEGASIGFSARQTRQETVLALDNATRTPIPDYALPRLFERYYTLNRAENSGLGLTLVRQIAEQHGGYVRAEAYAQGVRFILALPTRQP